ncbi:MAG: gluconate 2-dehydrogenase subunit 3 family protein [Saprospiraceae bacterium]
MDRREALKFTSLILGYSLTGTSAMVLFQGCKIETNLDWTPKFFSQQEINLIAEIAEIILPKTDTPGAKDALCERYIDAAVNGFYTKEKQSVFKNELKIFNVYSKNKYAKAFLALNKNEKENVLELIIEDMKELESQKGQNKHIFRTMRELTVLGYCTSEVGAKGGLFDYRPIPGPYKGCIEYSTVGKTWAL